MANVIVAMAVGKLLSLNIIGVPVVGFINIDIAFDVSVIVVNEIKLLFSSLSKSLMLILLGLGVSVSSYMVAALPLIKLSLLLPSYL